jgi:hypothetical protein
MQYYEFIAARGDTGAALPLAKITVYLAGTTTLASIYDSSGAGLSNPITAATSGLVGFAAANGAYDVQIASADGSYLAPKVHDLQLYDLSGLDAKVSAAQTAASAAAGSAGATAGTLTVVSAIRDSALAALAATAISGSYATYAAANSALASVIDGAFVQVLSDESHSGVRTIYQKIGGALVFKGEASGGPATKYVVAPRLDSPSGQTLLSFRSIGTADPNDNPQFTIQITHGHFNPTGGPVTTPGGSYYDNVFGIGWNLTSSFTPEIPGLPCTSYRIENQYCYISGFTGNMVRQAEVHVGAHVTTEAGQFNEFRPITMGLPHTKAQYGTDASITMAAAIYSFGPGDFTTGPVITLSAAPAGGNNYWAFHSVSVLQQGAPGTPWNQQYAPTIPGNINVPWMNIDGSNRLYWQNDYATVGQLSGSFPALLGTPAMRCMQIYSSVASGSIGDQVSWPDTTGNIIPFSHAGGASTFMEGQFYNYSGRAGLMMMSPVGGYYGFYVPSNGVGRGLSYNASTDTLTLGATDQHGASFIDALRIKPIGGSMQVSLLYPPIKPSYTKAGLPNPTTCGRGAEAYCTDESGGEVPVFSDNTNWRRVTDRAIVS